ncbi:hypothetical protein BGP_1139 [Beggiatoa sp. PS]|nr:hypothetical protein BGP_1139 [Beggiatoa sp. PS]
MRIPETFKPKPETNMRTIETHAMIAKDRILTLQLPKDIQPGQHYILVTIGEKNHEPKIPTELLPPQVLNKKSSKHQTAVDIHAAIAAYATQHAGTKMDLDDELEEAGIECLNAAEEKTT